MSPTKLISFLIITSFTSLSQNNNNSFNVIPEDDFWLNESNPSGMLCFFNFLSVVLERPRQISVLLPDDDETTSVRNILYQLNQRFPIYLVRRDIDASAIYTTIEDSIMVLNTFSDMDSIAIDELIDLCNPTCQYTAILTPVYDSVDSFMNDVDEWVRIIFERWVANLRIFFRVNDTIYMAKSFAYKPLVTCEPETPTVLGTCQDGSWDNWSAAYSQIMKFNNCSVPVAYVNTPPFAIDTKDPTLVADGVEGKLLTLVCKTLNLTMNSTEIEIDRNDEKPMDEILEGFLLTYDMIFGGLMWAPTEEVKYTKSCEILPLVWMVPRTTYISLTTIFTCFLPSVWFAIAVAFLVGSIKSIFSPNDITILDVFALFLGVSTFAKPRILSTRLHYIFWAIYGYVITNCFFASLAGTLVYNTRMVINTVDDLVKSDLKYGGSVTISHLFDHNSQTNKKLADNFIEYDTDDYQVKLQNLMSGREKGYALAVMLNSSKVEPDFNSNVYILQERLGTFPVAFACREGLSYIRQLNMVIQHVEGSGLMTFLFDKYSNITESTDKAEGRQILITLRHLLPAFLILAFGMVLASLAFFGELVADCRKKRNLVRKSVKKWKVGGLNVKKKSEF